MTFERMKGRDYNYISFSIANSTRACSTVILGPFPRNYGNEYYPNYERDEEKIQVGGFGGEVHAGSFEDFVADLVAGKKQFDDSQRANLSSYRLRKFAHIIVSTQDEQGLLEKYLEEFGFTPSPRVYNLKNSTTVTLWMMPIPFFLKRLDELSPKHDEEEGGKDFFSSFINKKSAKKSHSSGLSKSRYQYD